MNKIKNFIEKNKKIYIELILNDFKTRYNGSILGMIWGFIQPVVTILIYWLVFQYGLRSGTRPDGMPYVFYMIAGAVPWFYFSDALGGITTSFLDYSYLVKKLNFDIKLLPLVKVGSALIVHCAFIVICTIVLNFGGYYANWYYLQIIYYIIAVTVFAILLGFITSCFSVYIRDTIQVVGIVLQIGFWANPICWGEEMLGGVLGFILKLNPMYYCITGYRNCLFYQKGFWEDPYYTIYYWIFMLFLFLVARFVYKKMRPNFADVM